MDYLILMLATWRLSSLFTDEDGPFQIFAHLREWTETNISAELFNCLWCFSIWTGLILTVAYWYSPIYTRWIALPFALSAGAILIEKRV